MDPISFAKTQDVRTAHLRVSAGSKEVSETESSSKVTVVVNGRVSLVEGNGKGPLTTFIDYVEDLLAHS